MYIYLKLPVFKILDTHYNHSNMSNLFKHFAVWLYFILLTEDFPRAEARPPAVRSHSIVK